ncbi:putative lipase Lih1p [Monosporozyma unispora]|nr:hypothetical protein C6P44_003699 [Kazachstania unispora]
MMLLKLLLYLICNIPSEVFCKNVVNLSKLYEYSHKEYDIKFTDAIHERLVYFSKASSLASCITYYDLVPGLELNNGGCPPHIKFCQDNDINPTAKNTKIVQVLEAEKGELGTGYVMVDYEKEVIVVVFRSSTTSQDWFSDFTIQPTDFEPLSQNEYWKLVNTGKINKCKDCQIHRGVSKFTESLGKDFLEKIECILERYPNFKIVITGHSLGAALASMVGIELRLKGYYPLVLTYAPPRIFNTNLKEWVDELFETEHIHQEIIDTGEIQFVWGYFRVVHKNDYIPLVPPFYKVAGLEIFIRKIDLPHEKNDLDYCGTTHESFMPSETDTKLSGLVDQLLHTYEHSAYFVYMNGCKDF